MKKVEVKPGMFGNGRFSAEMERLYVSAIVLFALTEKQAEVFAKQAASDAGDVLKRAVATIKVGKANKDGKATISDASKVKGATMTNALYVVRAIQWCADAGPNGISYGNTAWCLVPELQKYVNGLVPVEHQAMPETETEKANS